MEIARGARPIGRLGRLMEKRRWPLGKDAGKKEKHIWKAMDSL